MHRFARVALVALLLCACSTRGVLARLTVPAHDQLARAFLSELHHDSIKVAAQKLTQATGQLEHVEDSLWSIALELPTGTFDTLRLINVERFWMRDVNKSELTYEVHGSGGWTVVTMTVVDEEGKRGIESVRAYRATASQSELNAFGNGGRAPLAWVVLLGAIAAVTFSLWAAIAVARTPMRRRWLWVAACLVGACELKINWATGEYAYSLLRVQLLSAGIMRSGLAGPWILSVSLPWGAILALRRRKLARTPQVTQKVTNADPPPAIAEPQPASAPDEL